MVTQDYQQTVLERFMSDVTLKSRVKGINWNTTVFLFFRFILLILSVSLFAF
jgi:hypothetical protein